MSKKPALKAATPNDVDASALFDDRAHDVLTERFTDPSKSNRLLVVGVVRVTEAGGHDDGGDRITKYRFDHIEAAFTEGDEKKLAAELTRLHKGRTQSSTVAALSDPVEDTPLDGVDGEAPELPNDSL